MEELLLQRKTKLLESIKQLRIAVLCEIECLKQEVYFRMAGHTFESSIMSALRISYDNFQTKTRHVFAQTWQLFQESSSAKLEEYDSCQAVSAIKYLENNNPFKMDRSKFVSSCPQLQLQALSSSSMNVVDLQPQEPENDEVVTMESLPIVIDLTGIPSDTEGDLQTLPDPKNKAKTSSQPSAISEENMGYQLLRRMGWHGYGSGLGRNGQGLTEPLPNTGVAKRKLGLGAEVVDEPVGRQARRKRMKPKNQRKDVEQGEIVESGISGSHKTRKENHSQNGKIKNKNIAQNNETGKKKTEVTYQPYPEYGHAEGAAQHVQGNVQELKEDKTKPAKKSRWRSRRAKRQTKEQQQIGIEAQIRYTYYSTQGNKETGSRFKYESKDFIQGKKQEKKQKKKLTSSEPSGSCTEHAQKSAWILDSGWAARVFGGGGKVSI